MDKLFQFVNGKVISIHQWSNCFGSPMRDELNVENKVNCDHQCKHEIKKYLEPKSCFDKMGEKTRSKTGEISRVGHSEEN
jgi:hypothetical protein